MIYLSFRTIFSCSKLGQYKIYTGKEVNKLGIKFVKTFRKDLTHNNFLFQENTLNTDHLPFNPTGKCSPGGIYFCEENKLSEWIDYNFEPNQFYAEIQLPDDAKVYNEGDKLKADKIYIGEIKKIPDEEYIKAIINNIGHKNNARKIQKLFCCIKNQTPEICKLVVQNHSKILCHIKKQTPEICLAAVNNNGLSLEFVKDQTPEICLAAVKQNKWALQFVKNQTPEMCLIAVQNNSHTIKYVKDQTPELCLIAVKKNGILLCYVKNQTPEICLAAVQQNKMALEYIIEQTPEIQLVA